MKNRKEESMGKYPGFLFLRIGVWLTCILPLSEVVSVLDDFIGFG